MRKLLLIALAGVAAAAHGATVAPDSLLCETPEPFQVIAADGWTSKGAIAQLNTAKQSADFYRLSVKAAGVKQGLASQEEAIRADSSLRLAAGSTTSRAVAAGGEASTAAAKVTAYDRVTAICAASGPAALPAEVLERKPISGTARVRVAFRDSPAELWVRTTDVSE